METSAESGIIKPRNPKTAARLSDLVYGLGQIYCGHLARGLVIYTASAVLLTALILLIALLKGRFMEAVLIGGVPAIAIGLFARFDARRLAAAAPADYRLKEYNHWTVYVSLAVIFVMVAICGAFFIRERAYEAFSVTSDRMSPTLRVGQRVIVNKGVYDVRPMRRGDVVIVRSRGPIRLNLVQRLVGLPGDRIELRGGQVLVNGSPAARFPAAAPTILPTRPADEAGERVLPRGQGFFVNDNPQAEFPLTDNSQAALGRGEEGDVGEAPLDAVVGRVEFVYWPRPGRVR